MKKIAIIIAATISFFSFNASAEDFSVKGYVLGQQMSACPENSVSNPGNAVLLCNLGPTTYAGADAVDHLVGIYNNEIISVMVQLKAHGRYANSGVLAAMKEKFGEPTISKAHLNNYIWKKGPLALAFDGYAGTIALVDIEKHRAANKVRAKASQDDL